MPRGPRATYREVLPARSRPLNLVTMAAESQRATRYCWQKHPSLTSGPGGWGCSSHSGFPRYHDAHVAREGLPGHLRETLGYCARRAQRHVHLAVPADREPAGDYRAMVAYPKVI